MKLCYTYQCMKFCYTNQFMKLCYTYQCIKQCEYWNLWHNLILYWNLWHNLILKFSYVWHDSFICAVIYEVVLHISMYTVVRVLSCVTNFNDKYQLSCVTHINGKYQFSCASFMLCYTYQWVMLVSSHTWHDSLTCVHVCVTHMNTHGWVTSHRRMRHVTRMNESMTHIWIRRVTRIDEWFRIRFKYESGVLHT